MAANIKEVLDRMHTLNQTIKSITVNSASVNVNHARYWPSSTMGLQPLVVPVWLGVLRYEQRPGNNRVQGTHQFANYLLVEDVTAGLITQTAQQTLEQLYPALEDLYWDHLQLQNNDNGLANVILCLPGPAQPTLPEIEAQVECLYEITLRRSN